MKYIFLRVYKWLKTRDKINKSTRSRKLSFWAIFFRLFYLSQSSVVRKKMFFHAYKGENTQISPQLKVAFSLETLHSSLWISRTNPSNTKQPACHGGYSHRHSLFLSLPPSLRCEFLLKQQTLMKHLWMWRCSPIFFSPPQDTFFHVSTSKWRLITITVLSVKQCQECSLHTKARECRVFKICRWWCKKGKEEEKVAHETWHPILYSLFHLAFPLLLISLYISCVHRWIAYSSQHYICIHVNIISVAVCCSPFLLVSCIL